MRIFGEPTLIGGPRLAVYVSALISCALLAALLFAALHANAQRRRLIKALPANGPLPQLVARAQLAPQLNNATLSRLNATSQAPYSPADSTVDTSSFESECSGSGVRRDLPAPLRVPAPIIARLLIVQVFVALLVEAFSYEPTTQAAIRYATSPLFTVGPVAIFYYLLLGTSGWLFVEALALAAQIWCKARLSNIWATLDKRIRLANKFANEKTNQTNSNGNAPISSQQHYNANVYAASCYTIGANDTLSPVSSFGSSSQSAAALSRLEANGGGIVVNRDAPTSGLLKAARAVCLPRVLAIDVLPGIGVALALRRWSCVQTTIASNNLMF